MSAPAVQLDLLASRAARDRGLSLVRSVNAEWVEAAMKGLREFAAARLARGISELTVEEFRAHWNANGGAQPTKHNAWGALGNAVARSGWLVYVRHEAAKSVKTHSHRIAVYRINGSQL
jgi:hypothetical protein